MKCFLYYYLSFECKKSVDINIIELIEFIELILLKIHFLEFFILISCVGIL